MSVIDTTKELLSNPLYRIKLHDLIAENTRATLTKLSSDTFPLQAPWSVEELSSRIEKYQTALSELLSISTLIGYWGTADHKEIMSLASKRLSSGIQKASGLNAWIALQWYPTLLLTYAIGLGAIAANNYENLYGYFHSEINDLENTRGTMSLIETLFYSVGDIQSAFKSLPGHERHFVPVSEYLYKYFQPRLDDLLFIGNEYEPIFDRLEIFIALEYGYERVKTGHSFWAPVGRFGWKSRHGSESSPLHRLINDAKKFGNTWAPLKAGMFGGSFESFDQVSSELLNLVSQRGWI